MAAGAKENGTMKRLLLGAILAAMAAATAVEIDVDGKFRDFNRMWRTSSKRIGTAELIPDKGENFVHLSSADGPRGQIGIYTARGIPAVRGDRISVAVDASGGPFEIALFEYGAKKHVGAVRKTFPKTRDRITRRVEFTVTNENTDTVRVSFSVKRGAAAVISDVRVDMQSARKDGNEKK